MSLTLRASLGAPLTLASWPWFTNPTVPKVVVVAHAHSLTGEPLESSVNFDPALRDQLAALGHDIVVPNEVAGAAHGAEIFRPDGGLRAGGNTWAAGF